MEELQEYFYVGLYQKVVNSASSIKNPDDMTSFMILRSYLSLGQTDFVLKTVRSQSNPLQKGVFLLAKAKKCNTPSEISELIPTDDEEIVATSEIYVISKATLCIQAERVADAMAIVSAINQPEAICLKIHCLLLLNRADLAEKELEKLEQPILKSIWTSFVSLYQNKDQIQKSLYSLQDLAERFEVSPLLANAMACCHFALGEWESGNMDIQSALEIYPNDDTLQINKAVALHRTNEYDKLKTQISLVTAMKNQYTQNIENMLKDFDETAERLETE